MRPSNIYLKQKSASFLSKLVGANLTRTHALMAYNTMFIPAMIYGLPATNVDLDKLKCIQDKAVQKFLSVSGFNNTFPRAACFAPKKFGGVKIHQNTYGSQLKENRIGRKSYTSKNNVRASDDS